MTSALLAPAKINLSLQVTARRTDGYHLLDSLVAFADIGDRVTVSPAPAIKLHVTGPFAQALDSGPGNLVMRAAHVLAAGRTLGAEITLEKNLPIASGIGGGSSDAATTLLALSRLWNVPLDPAAPAILVLGADVPVCLRRRPTRMTGIGEILADVPALPPCGVVLINPGVPLATAAVFRAFSGPFAAAPELPTSFGNAAALAKYLAGTTNALRAAAQSLVPTIGDCLAALDRHPECLIARLSGSGPTCFGLFANRDKAERAAAALKPHAPGWWIAHGELKSIAPEPA